MADARISAKHHHAGARRGEGAVQSGFKIGDAFDLFRDGAKARRMSAEIHRLLRTAIGEQVVESHATGSALQPIDAAEAAIVQHHDGQFHAEHHRCRDLGVQHQVAAVADQHDHLTLGPSQLDAKAAGDLVAHAGVAVFQVVGADLPRLPQLVQLTWQSTGGADHDGVLRCGTLDRADHLCIRWQFGIGWRGHGGGVFAPGADRTGQAAQPGVGRAVAGERCVKLDQCRARVGDQRVHVMLRGIEHLHVEADEAARGILEQSP